MNDIVIFEAESQQVEVRLEGETLWLSLQQMVDLFGRNKSVISRHLKNIYDTNELERERTVAKNATVQKEGEREVIRQVEYFNLDAIISVGYRVNSTQATRFRQWATRVLREHLTRGYSLNEHRLARQGLDELTQAVDLLGKTLTRQELVTDIGREVIGLILGYSRTWRLLLDYDEDKLSLPVGSRPARGVLGFEEARRALDALAVELKNRGEASELFARDRADNLFSILVYCFTLGGTFRAPRNRQDKAQRAGNGHALVKRCNAVMAVSGAPFGRAAGRPSAVLRLLARATAIAAQARLAPDRPATR